MINLRSIAPSHSLRGANRNTSFASFAARDSILGNIGQPLGGDTEVEDCDDQTSESVNYDTQCANMVVDGIGKPTSGVQVTALVCC